MSDEIKQEIPKEEQAKPVEMRIILFPDGSNQVHFPLLNNKLITYGVLKLAEKNIDNYYKENDNKIIKNSGGIINFLRGKR